MRCRAEGQWFQSESGLHQNWMRDYDPTTGRYIQADPLGLVDGASVYGYALQNPGRYVDPTGQCPWCAAVAAGFIAGAGVALIEELFRADGRLECVNWRNVLGGGLFGAALSTLGPTGLVLGRGGTRAAQYGFGKSAGLLNHGHIRFGWGYSASSGRTVLRGGAGRSHFDSAVRWPWTRAHPVADGAATGLFGGAFGPEADEFNPDCACGE